jgi:16S rRNA processing protein RimM
VGFHVRTTGGAEVGSVVETIDTGSNDVWVVRTNEREILIPVIADVVRRIDRRTRTVIIEPLDGLLDV